jgi:hypothetical protein
MKHFVFDSFAPLVFFELQKDWRKIERYLVQASSDMSELSIPNLEN